MADENRDKEIELTIAGQHGRAKGYRLLDLIWLPMLLAVSYTAFTLYHHEATAQNVGKDVAASVREANKDVVNALKESNSATVKAIDALATEQKKSTIVMREMVCLSDPTMRNRSDAREFCKRISRDDR